MEKEYRHLGYYNDIEDIEGMREFTPGQIVTHFLCGFGNFHEPSSFEYPVERNLIDAEYGSDVRESGKYLIIMDIDNDEKEDNFIDIYIDNSEELRINKEPEIVEVRLDPNKTPSAFASRVEDLMKDGMSRKQAVQWAYEPIEMEIYFQPHQGMFLVETEAVESTDIFSPYTQERYKSPLEGEDEN